MDLLLSRWESARDYRAVFVRSYRAITVRIEEAIRAGVFEDNAWMEGLDVGFAMEYFDAVEAYEAGVGPLPDCWRTAFDLAVRKKTTVLQDLLLGMAAHIIHDLPIALFKRGLPVAERTLRRRDHERVGDVLAESIDRVQRDVSRHYSLVLNSLDRLAGRHDEMLTGVGIRAARTQAWHMAVALAEAPDPAARDRLLRTLDGAATATARLVAPAPPLLGRFISIARRWDGALANLAGRG